MCGLCTLRHPLHQLHCVTETWTFLIIITTLYMYYIYKSFQRCILLLLLTYSNVFKSESKRKCLMVRFFMFWAVKCFNFWWSFMWSWLLTLKQVGPFRWEAEVKPWQIKSWVQWCVKNACFSHTWLFHLQSLSHCDDCVHTGYSFRFYQMERTRCHK